MLQFFVSLVLIYLATEFARYIIEQTKALGELDNTQDAISVTPPANRDMINWFYSSSDEEPPTKQRLHPPRTKKGSIRPHRRARMRRPPCIRSGPNTARL